MELEAGSLALAYALWGSTGLDPHHRIRISTHHPSSTALCCVVPSILHSSLIVVVCTMLYDHHIYLDIYFVPSSEEEEVYSGTLERPGVWYISLFLGLFGVRTIGKRMLYDIDTRMPNPVIVD